MDLKKLYEKTNGGLGQDHFSFTQAFQNKTYWYVDCGLLCPRSKT